MIFDISKRGFAILALIFAFIFVLGACSSSPTSSESNERKKI